MYRCQNCDVLVTAGSKVNRIVVDTRPRSYEQSQAPKGRKKRKTKGRFQNTESHGWEIVRELAVCGTCCAKLSEEIAPPVIGTPTIRTESEVQEETRYREDEY
jgi:hypothetical protein